MDQQIKIAIVIPARLNSRRVPNKVLHSFLDLPMIEHVRRRAQLSSNNCDVYVATCDEAVAELIDYNSGRYIKTLPSHLNGTERVCEAIQNIDCTHIILLQGDELLIMPEYIDRCIEAIVQKPEVEAWNVTSAICDPEFAKEPSVVKCIINAENRILFCSRFSPFTSPFPEQKKFLRQILGVMCYRRDFLQKLVQLPQGCIERAESVEQLRIIENGFSFYSISVPVGYPSLNTKKDIPVIDKILRTDKDQIKILSKYL